MNSFGSGLKAYVAVMVAFLLAPLLVIVIAAFSRRHPAIDLKLTIGNAVIPTLNRLSEEFIAGMRAEVIVSEPGLPAPSAVVEKRSGAKVGGQEIEILLQVKPRKTGPLDGPLPTLNPARFAAVAITQERDVAPQRNIPEPALVLFPGKRAREAARADVGQVMVVHHAGGQHRLLLHLVLGGEAAGAAAHRRLCARLLAFRRLFGGELAGLQRFADQFVGQHQPRFIEGAERQLHQFLFVAARVVALEREHRISTRALHAENGPAKALASVGLRRGEFNARLVTDGAREIRDPHQWTVDAGRRHFQPIGLRNGVFDVEHRRQRLARQFAIVDVHRAVGLLGHDLQRHAVLAGDLHAHQTEAEAHQGRSCDMRNARRQTGLGIEARLIQRCVDLGFDFGQAILRSGDKGVQVTKKSGSRRGPTLTMTIQCGP